MGIFLYLIIGVFVSAYNIVVIYEKSKKQERPYKDIEECMMDNFGFIILVTVLWAIVFPIELFIRYIMDIFRR